ncbi:MULTISPECIES: TolC family protein [Methylotenera]|uniref:TolC family protein n=1 Tax=Methylotenera TaxID=359407 RepID=UPI000375BDA9|nr:MULTISPECIES: TolC family protein [Methylotenera]
MKIPQKKQAANIALTICSLSIFCGLISSCAKEKYVAKPLDPQVVNAKISNKNPANAAFNAYLIQQGYAQTDLPLQLWGLNELTSAALYFNPKLDVAKAQLALANAAIDTAHQRQNPTLNGSLARSNRANGDIDPWSYGLNVDIPIETANKRAIRVEEAQHLRDAAELDVAEIAWQLRSQIAKDLMTYHENIALQQELSHQLKVHTDIVNMLEKRLALGLIDSSTLNDAKLIQQRTQIVANALPTQLIEIRAALAADTGLSLDQLNTMAIKPIDVDVILTQQSDQLNQQDLNGQKPFKTFQQYALLNRLDIRRSLAKYAAAEAKIKLEVAKQTPDINLTPGFLFEFGDSIWSLGFSNLLNLLNRNQTLIAEATQLREIEGAQFEVLQTNIISDLNLAYAQLTTALQNIQQTQSQLENQANQQRKLQKQLDAGLTDRLAVTQQSLNYLLAEQQLLTLKFNGLKAMIAIEDLMQRPIDDTQKNAIVNAKIGLKNE